MEKNISMLGIHFPSVSTICLLDCFCFFHFIPIIFSYIPEHTSSPPVFQWGLCYSIFGFLCMFCGSLFVLLYFFFWPLCCLFFFDIRILITPLVSSSYSYWWTKTKYIEINIHLPQIAHTFITYYSIHCILPWIGNEVRLQW